MNKHVFTSPPTGQLNGGSWERPLQAPEVSANKTEADIEKWWELVDRVIAVARQFRWTKAEVTRRSGMKDATFSQWFSGRYEGRLDNHNAMIEQWLDALQAAASVAAMIPQAPSFMQLRGSAEVLETLTWAQICPDLVMITLGAGMGKTAACEYFTNILGEVNVTQQPAQTPGNGNYVGVQALGSVYAPASTGTAKDSIFGSNSYCRVVTGASGWWNAAGDEADVNVDEDVDYKWSYAAGGLGTKRGTLIDTAFYADYWTSGQSWKTGFQVGGVSSISALGTDGTFLKAVVAAGISYGLDLYGTPVSQSYLRGNDINLIPGEAQFSKVGQILKLGNPTTASTVRIYGYTTGGGAASPDSTISFSGGTAGTLNGGNLTLSSSNIVAGGVFRPGTDNSFGLGSASYRWSQLWAATATIATSDERHKENIQIVASHIALSFLKNLNAITYKLKDEVTDEVVEVQTATRQKMKMVLKPVESSRTELVEGVAFRRTEVAYEEVSEPEFIAHFVYDPDTGEQLFEDVPKRVPVTEQIPFARKARLPSGKLGIVEGTQPREHMAWEIHKEPVIHLEPVMETYEERILVSPARSKKNIRTHWGFSAQQVETAIQAIGLTSQDFAGLVYDAEADIYGLRYEQFIPILWSVLQTALQRIEDLEARDV
ncbi:tail fiber domain-containing protein [Agrobacterium vitis]|uniref:tail fiber domain-containing protein n=1 Tax=Agrobacterium vitis TaxID=373 RepID=UPI000ABF5D18|nr:tail fiber domain-containing protein [Agrobacterium vitis]MUZ99088.1 hypothetical protein [Agrobacterium vitis]NOJ33744.1 tail fiber domain-containing protein [Agrobacterium vitis]NSZ48496.1 tail fiber domain-containing protein [Agrobacterium vitis]UJL73090.1 tail fiber domain-containing protein [Agrobacterium vitis]